MKSNSLVRYLPLALVLLLGACSNQGAPIQVAQVNEALAGDDTCAAPVITDAQMRAQYDRWVSLLDDTEYKARHILVETREQAVAALNRLARGDSFEVVAREVSRDPDSAVKGGDLGWGHPKDYVPPFGEALKYLKRNETRSEPVQTPFGWHIIEVLDIRPAVHPTYEQMKDRIEANLRKRAKVCK
jgi:peptidyl-prolyl cis-trans isomerase C